MYWIKFYENGVFVTALGQPYDSIDNAKLGLAVMASKMNFSGFTINYPDDNHFTYDRYGTLCTVKIEEVGECS